MTETYEGQLEIDRARGVIYFHTADPKAAEAFGSVSILRICRLPKPIPRGAIDITHMHGVHFGRTDRNMTGVCAHPHSQILQEANGEPDAEVSDGQA